MLSALGNYLWETLSLAAQSPSEHGVSSMEPHRTFYTAVMGLARGSEAPRRRPLPEELVMYICRLAEFHLEHIEESPQGDVKVYAHGGDVVDFTWFRTHPFTQYEIKHMESLQLITLSRHQGWVSLANAGSWSWFELRIARPDPSDPHMPYNRTIGSWRSHEHPIRSQKFEEHQGTVFGYDHPLWDTIQEGDMLEVVMKAQFGGWANIARHARVRIVTRWEPSAEMLTLMYAGPRVNDP